MILAPILLRASLADSDNAALSAQTDLLAQDISQKILAQLGAAPGDVPDLDSIIAPASVPARLIVTFRRDGSADRSTASAFGDTTATTMLIKAFDALRASSEAALAWPGGYLADSIVVRIDLASAPVSASGNVILHATQHPAFGVFRLLAPPLSPALLRPHQQPPHYPAEAEGARVAGYVELQFVVDTDGRAETTSIHDVRELGRQHMTPDAFQYYDAFVREMRKALLRWRFTPAHIDACPVTQWVALPVEFSAPGRM